MRIERGKNARRNIWTGLALKALTVLSPFVIRLIIIRSLGAEYVGLSGLFTSVLSILNLAELGIGSAIIYSMYEPVANDDYCKLGAILRLYRKTYLVIAALIFISGLILMPFIPYMIKDGYPQTLNIYVLYLIYLFNSIAGYVCGSYRISLYSVHQREDVINRVTFAVQIVSYTLEIIILLVLKNYYFYAVFIALGNMAINAILASKSKREYPMIVESGEIEPAERKKIVKGIGGLFLNKVSSTVRNSCDSVFLTTFVGLVMNALFSNYFYIMTALNSVILIFPQSIKAGIGNSLNLQNEDDNYSDYMILQFSYMFLSGLAVIGFATVCQTFSEIVFGEELRMDNSSFALMVAYLFMTKVVDINNVFIDASGMWWRNKWATILDVVFNLAMDWILGMHYGLWGILLASVMSVYFFQFLLKTLICFKVLFPNHSSIRYILFQHIMALIILGSLWLGWKCGLSIGINNYYLELAIIVVLSCLAFCILFSSLFFRNRYYLKSVEKLKGMFHR